MWNLKTIEKTLYQSFQEQISAALGYAGNKEIAVWGAGVRGLMAGMILEDLGREKFIYIDNDVSRQGKSLSGHSIKSFAEINMQDIFVIISMEIHSEVTDGLIKLGFVENIDFSILSLDDKKSLFEKLIAEKKKTFICGKAILHTVPVEEREEEDLAELLEEKIGMEWIKVLGMPCMGLKNIYYLVRYEISHNPKLQNIVIMINFMMITSYNHLLPRVQKLELLEYLWKEAETEGNEEEKRELTEAYFTAKERAKNYKLENQYSPGRIDSDRPNRLILKDYFEISDMEQLDPSCESFSYLRKILKFAKEKGINVVLMLEPMNMKLSRELNNHFPEIYSIKCRFLADLAAEYNARFVNSQGVVENRWFLNTNRPGNAIKKRGRILLADFIVKHINESGNGFEKECD